MAAKSPLVMSGKTERGVMMIGGAGWPCPWQRPYTTMIGRQYKFLIKSEREKQASFWYGIAKGRQ